MLTPINTKGLQIIAELSFQDRCRIVTPDFSGPTTELNIVEERVRVDLDGVNLTPCRYLPKSSDKLLTVNPLGELIGVLFVPVGTEVSLGDTIVLDTLHGPDLEESLFFDIESEPEIGHVQIRIPLKTSQILLPS